MYNNEAMKKYVNRFAENSHNMFKICYCNNKIDLTDSEREFLDLPCVECFDTKTPPPSINKLT